MRLTVCADAQAGLRLCYLQTPKTGFLTSRPSYNNQRIRLLASYARLVGNTKRHQVLRYNDSTTDVSKMHKKRTTVNLSKMTTQKKLKLRS